MNTLMDDSYTPKRDQHSFQFRYKKEKGIYTVEETKMGLSIFDNKRFYINPFESYGYDHGTQGLISPKSG